MPAPPLLITGLWCGERMTAQVINRGLEEIEPRPRISLDSTPGQSENVLLVVHDIFFAELTICLDNCLDTRR